MNTRTRQVVYVSLGVIGTIIPWYFVFELFGHNQGLGDFLRLAFANPASTAVAVDISLSAVVFSIWVILECRRLGMRHPWFYILLNAGALALALGVFFAVREKKLDERATSRGAAKA